MTTFKLPRALALALVDCAWERDALLARVVHVVGEYAPWMREVVDDAIAELVPHHDRFEIAGEQDTAVEPEPDDVIDVEMREWLALEGGELFDDDEVEEDPPDKLRQLTDWLKLRPALGYAFARGARARRPWLEAPEMRDSPWHVPALPTHGELARWLGMSHERLDILADRHNLSRDSRDPRARHYRYTWLEKRNAAGHRLLEAPKPALRTLQRYVLDDILAYIPPHPAAHGFRRGHSVRTFAAPHVGREVVLRVDLRAFFTSIWAARVAAMFRTAGYPAAIAATLAALCTHATPRDVIRSAPSVPDRGRLESRHLPQGAPTSGALANLAAYRFDVRVAALAARIGAQYTRYADDLALSGPASLARSSATVLARIAAIAHDEGFAVNATKTRVMRASTRQRLTGLVVNQRLAIARRDLDELRAILHNCVRFGPETQNRGSVADFRAHLQGRVSWVASVDARKGARLAAELARITWPVATPLPPPPASP
ncbi:MAG: reverse transcriptase family protein [Deltaproteobacteria bacterium]